MDAAVAWNRYYAFDGIFGDVTVFLDLFACHPAGVYCTRAVAENLEVATVRVKAGKKSISLGNGGSKGCERFLSEG